MSSSILIASDVPLREVTYPPDHTVIFDVDRSVVDDGGMDDGFAIIPRERVLELSSEKKYFAVLEWQYTPRRAKKVIEYLKEHLAAADELELWHIWQDMDFDHRVRRVAIPISELSANDIKELNQLEVWKKPVTDYCYAITR